MFYGSWVIRETLHSHSDVDSDWFFAQHDANIASTNTTGAFQLAMFDNGDDRPIDASGTPCAGYVQPYCYSTAAIFQVDEDSRTASRFWSSY